MCLTLREKNYKQPYNKSKIRYKFLELYKGTQGDECLYSPYTGFDWKVGKQMKAFEHEIPKDLVAWSLFGQEGFHVFVDRSDAKSSVDEDEVLVELEVSGFIASGDWDGSCLKSEVWKYAKITKVWRMNNEGNLVNVTRKFLKNNKKGKK